MPGSGQVRPCRARTEAAAERTLRAILDTTEIFDAAREKQGRSLAALETEWAGADHQISKSMVGQGTASSAKSTEISPFASTISLILL